MHAPLVRLLRRISPAGRTGWLVFLFGFGCLPPLPAGEPAAAPDVGFEFALYFAPSPTSDPEKELARLLADPACKLASSKAAGPRDSVAWVASKWSPLADYAPPTVESMRYFGKGIAPEVAIELAKAERVFIIGIVAPRPTLLLANRAACQLLADLASATGGLIWDEETRQVFSIARWQADRLDSWQGGVPDLTKHVTMHAYADPELVRIITLGMRKFGHPDLVVSNVPSQHSRAVGNFINAFLQRLGEGQKPEEGKMSLTLAEIRHQQVRESALANPGAGAKGVVAVSVKAIPPKQGDPQNVLWNLDFPEARFKQSTERTMWGMEQLFGSTDRVTMAKSGDAEMAEASARARKAFFAQEGFFRAGLPFKEHLLVKAPFTAGDKTEYMWVEITAWRQTEVEGVLSSNPQFVKTLHPGSKVSVPLVKIYDYLYYKADGTEEGNETGKVLERMGN